MPILKPSGLVTPDGRPVDDSVERIVDYLGRMTNAAAQRFKAIGSERAPLVITCPNQSVANGMQRLIQSGPAIHGALMMMEEKAAELKAKADDMNDYEIGSEAAGWSEAAALLRSALYRKAG